MANITLYFQLGLFVVYHTSFYNILLNDCCCYCSLLPLKCTVPAW